MTLWSILIGMAFLGVVAYAALVIAFWAIHSFQ